MLPALAWIAAAPAKFRLVLRLLVPLAILQILHAYPSRDRSWVGGWSTMCVPCVLAIAFAAKTRPGIEARRAVRCTAPRSPVLSALLLLGAGLSPIKVWHDYSQLTPLDLRGARLVRLEKADVTTIRGLATFVQRQCDTFYSAPGFDSLYIYTGPARAEPASFSNWPRGAHDRRGPAPRLGERLEPDRAPSGERVCIIRNLKRFNLWVASSYEKGPLGQTLALYKHQIGHVGQYAV